MHKLYAHLGRLGGMLIRPRATLARIVETGEGSLLELMPWFVLVTMAIAPVEAGKVVLLFRLGIVDGLTSLVNLVSNRMAPALGGALCAGVVLAAGEALFRARDDRRGFDLALDAVAFTLVPYLLLATAGALLSLAGYEAAYLPHRTLKGALDVRVWRVIVGYGWSVILFGVLASIFWRRPRRA